MEDTCPYCHKEIEIIHDDGYGYEEDLLHHQGCHHCGKSFVYTTSIIIHHSTLQADCLNGGDHNYLPTKTFPKEYTDMECTMCGNGRNPTAEEKTKYGIPVK